LWERKAEGEWDEGGKERKQDKEADEKWEKEKEKDCCWWGLVVRWKVGGGKGREDGREGGGGLGICSRRKWRGRVVVVVWRISRLEKGGRGCERIVRGCVRRSRAADTMDGVE
jgi:hypothetical protein